MVEANRSAIHKLQKRRVRGQGKDGTESYIQLAEDLRLKIPIKFGVAYDSLGSAKLIAETIGRVRGVAGPFAEIGCWKGGTGWFIREFMRFIGRANDRLYLYDTFEGYVDIDEDKGDDIPRSVRYRDTSEEEVKAAFQNDPNVIIRKGRFPDSIGPEKDMKFAFVHLDVDTYYSTSDALHWLKDHMSPGGAVILDDWGGPYSQGATRAIQEFMSEIDEKVGDVILFPRKAIYYCYDEQAAEWGSAIDKIVSKRESKKVEMPKSSPEIVHDIKKSAQTGYGPTVDPSMLSGK